MPTSATSGSFAAAAAQVPLADQPVFSAVNVPGNLALALSVEYPTAISVAHPDRTYSSGNTYIGYFDPAKCYDYHYTNGVGLDNYFYPVGRTTTHKCSGKWSGNYLNWASMQTIDPFRWALTGGYRVIDEPSLTVLEKAWGTEQGNTANFPDSGVSVSAEVAGATPFSTASGIATRIWSLKLCERGDGFSPLPAAPLLLTESLLWESTRKSPLFVSLSWTGDRKNQMGRML